jgi:phage baseplate assembly protein W
MSISLSPAARFAEPARPLTPAQAWAERLRILLSTRPGTLPWRKTFGVDLDWLVGQPLTSTNLNLLKWRVRGAITDWLPQLEVRELTVHVVSDHVRASNLRDRTIPIAESALLPYGAGGRVEIHLDVVSPEGPLDFGMTLSE